MRLPPLMLSKMAMNVCATSEFLEMARCKTVYSRKGSKKQRLHNVHTVNSLGGAADSTPTKNVKSCRSMPRFGFVMLLTVIVSLAMLRVTVDVLLLTRLAHLDMGMGLVVIFLNVGLLSLGGILLLALMWPKPEISDIIEI